MSDSTSRSDGLCDRCSRFLHFKGGEHGDYAEYIDEDGTVRLDRNHTRYGKTPWIQFRLEDDYPAMTELRRLASQGCSFCNLLLIEIQKQAPKVEKNMVLRITRGFIEETWKYRAHCYNSGVMLEWGVFDFKTKDGPMRRWSGQINFKLLANQGTMAVKYLNLLYGPLHSSLLCSENITRIQQALLDCSANHEKCATNRPTGHWKNQALPSRLLQIRKDQTGYRIRLVKMQPRTTPEPGSVYPKYAALSYCWGDREFIKSTPENITNHYDTIIFSELPPGFQDTIELCWGIGIFYLWIDSLCIIQGDQSDWDRESARMKDVYANASLTIILASTSSPLEGPSYIPIEWPLEVLVSYRLDNDNGPKITYFIHPPSSAQLASSFEPSRGEPEHGHEVPIRTSKWHSRGWTFQESILSTRKLFICSGHTDFSCRTSSRLEGVHPICRPLDDLGRSLLVTSRPGDWYDLVGQYSRRKLSRLEDKLPAISAVASLVGEGCGDYIAGLWTKSLERGLLWRPHRAPSDGFACKGQTTYMGPTWSWCAYDGVVSYQTIELSMILTRAFDVLEIRWTLAEPGAIYGRLSTADGDRAYLRVRAKVAWVTVQSEGKLDDGAAAVMEFGGTRERGTFWIDYGEAEDFKSPQRVAAMLVATDTDPISIFSDFGLFLRPIPSLGPVITYERVGCFSEGVYSIFENITEVQELCLV